MTGFEIAMITMMVASAVGGAHQAQQAGKAQESAFKQQARQEETAAQERELVRKQKINKVLAAQIAGLGASGIGAEGSPQLIAQESIKQASLGEVAGAANLSMRKSTLRNEGATARKLGNLQTATTLISGTTQAGLQYDRFGE